VEHVGESGKRNREFKKKFSRERVLAGLIDPTAQRPVVFDVGAHVGESVLFLRRLFPTSVIYSFEPSIDSFSTLQGLRDERTHCYNVALTDIDGSIEFFSNKISHTNSVFRVNSESRDSLFFEEHRRSGTPVREGEFNMPLRVPSMRLSTFCSAHRIDHIHLLKIDVQGAELRVLQGSGDALNSTDCIILEIMFYDYYEHQGSFLEIESVLQPLGFRLFSISEISYNPMNGRTDWVEAIYRRPPVRAERSP
jgi:FkbM family methyltransferase